MQQHEFAAYEDLTVRMLRDLKPVTEPEKQIAQKIIDLNCDTIESAMKMIEGSARSMGVEVVG